MVLDDFHGIARANARSALSAELERRVAEEAGRTRRSRNPGCLRKGREGYHSTLVIADEPLVDVVGLSAIGRVALHIDALDASPVDEVVHIAAAPSGRERAVHVRGRDAQSGDTLLVDIDLQAGDVGKFAKTYLRQLRIG